MNTRAFEIEYFYDSLCGWCYGSSQALAALANAYPEALRMRPSGLFGGRGARSMSSIADHSWRTSRRIVEMTGVEYGQAYIDGVLRNPDALFDSTYATRAIQVAGEIDPLLEPAMLHALQRGRYVDGKDTSQAEGAAAVAMELLSDVYFPADEASFADQLVRDDGLASRTSRRIEDTAERMRTFSTSGVPVILVTDGRHREVVDGDDLYGGGAVVLQAIEGVRSRAASRSAA